MFCMHLACANLRACVHMCASLRMYICVSVRIVCDSVYFFLCECLCVWLFACICVCLYVTTTRRQIIILHGVILFGGINALSYSVSMIAEQIL